MFRPPTKYSEYLQDVRKSIDYILKRVNATTVNKIVAGTNVTISPADGTGIVTINASGGGGGGLPAGGTTGQILAKINNVDYNAQWIDNFALWTSTVQHEVKASEPINKGQAVYVSGADGTNMIVSKASNTSEATSSKTMGLLAQTLATNGKGFVITEGLLAGLNTSGATAGDPVWLGASGNLIYGLINKPYAPLNLVFIGIVTRVNANNGEIFVKVQNGFELDELHNVDARNPNNNDGIFYNSSTMLWEHKPVSAVYATPTLAQVTTAGNTTTNAITVGGLTSNASSIIIGAAAGTLGSRVLTIQGSLPEIFFNDTFGTGTGFSLSKYGSLFYFVNTTSAGAYTNYAGVINPLAASWSFGHGGNPTATVHIKGADVLSSTKALLVQNSSPTDLLTIWNDGAVGINTSTNAGYKLDVNGTSRFQGSVTNTSGGFISTLTSPTSDAFYTFTSGAIGFYTSHAYTKAQRLNLTNTTGLPSTPNNVLLVSGSITASSALAAGVYFNNTLVAAANNDVLVGLDINPTFTNGAFTGVGNIGLRVSGQVLFNAYGAYNTVTPTLRIENVDTNNVAIQIKGNVANYKYYWIYDSQTTEGIYKSDQARIDFYGGTNVGFAFRNNYGRLFTIVGSTGNVLIGTTTDAGYKLDVNGTARVGNDFTIDNNRYLKAYRWTNADTSFPLQLESNSTHTVTGINFISYNNNLLNNTKSLFTFGLVSPITTQSSGSVDVANVINIVPEINFAFGTHTVRGIYYNPTLTSLTGTTHRAIETTSGDVIFNGGFVGVGTTTPQSPAGYNGITINSASSGSYVWFQTGGTNRYSIGSEGGDIWHNIFAGANTYFRTGGNYWLTIAATTGNILIGTTTDAGYKLDVNGSARVGSLGLYGNNGTITAPLIRFNGSNQVNVDPQGYGIVTNHSLTTGNYIFSSGGGIRSNDRFAAKSGTSVMSTPFMSYGISRPDADVNMTLLAGMGGVYDGASGWYQGLGLVFYTSNGPDISGGSYLTEKMRLSSVGNLGLGTTNPTDKIHIVDNTNGNKFARISAGGTDASAAWVAQNDQVDNVVYRVFGSAVTGSQMGISLARSASLMANLGGSGKFLVGTYSATDFVMGTGNQERMRLVDSTGNFLIGTTTDAGYRLNVSGSIRSTLDVVAEGNLKSNYQAGNEGGEINLNTPATGTTINTGVTIDVYQNKLRIFESGGLNRGGYFDISALANGVGTNFSPVGYTGILNILGNPPGQQNIDIQNGIIINIF